MECEWKVIVGKSVGYCLVADLTHYLTREEVLEQCLLARDESVLVTGARFDYYEDKDTWFYPQSTCGASVGFPPDHKQEYPQLEGIPDKDNLPADWPAGQPVKDWMDGRFSLTVWDVENEEMITQYYEPDGSIISNPKSYQDAQKVFQKWNEIRPW